VLIKDGSRYHVGAYNGVYMQIVRSNVDVPKSELELELDKIQAEKQLKIDALKGSEIGSKSDREIFLEAQAKKRDIYFNGFKVKYGIAGDMTMDKLFSEVPNASDAFDDYIHEQEDAVDEQVSEYLDVDDGSY